MFLKKYLTLLICLNISLFLNAQTLEIEWVAEYEEVAIQHGGMLRVDGEKNIYVCGQNAGPVFSTSFLTLKYDSLGNFLWEAGFDHYFADHLTGCELTEYGLVVAGTVDDFIDSDPARAIMISYDHEGGERWLKYLFDTLDYAASLLTLEIDDSGYLYAFGSVCPAPCDNSSEETNVYAAKIDPDTGETLWLKSEFSGSNALAKIVGDKIRVYGPTKINTPSSFHLRELDLDGNVLDSAIFPQIFGMRFLDSNGDLISANDHICKMTIEGDTAWCFDFTEGNPDFTGKVTDLTSGENAGVLATGWLKHTVPDNNFTQTVRLDSDGNKIWLTKDDFFENQALESGVNIAFSDKYVFVSSKVSTGEFPDYYSSFRPILYSLEDGMILHDTLIDFSHADFPDQVFWDGEHFYLEGTYFVGNSSQRPYSIALFKFNLDEPVPAHETTERKNKISLSPNPFNDSFGLFIEAIEGGRASVRIFNPLGQQVYRSKTRLNKGHNNIDVDGTGKWASGFYFVSIEINGQTHTEKIVKKE